MPWGPGGPPPLLIKIAPDLSEVDLMDVAAVALKTGVDGLVVGNTTIQRPGVGVCRWGLGKGCWEGVGGGSRWGEGVGGGSRWG